VMSARIAWLARRMIALALLARMLEWARRPNLAYLIEPAACELASNPITFALAVQHANAPVEAATEGGAPRGDPSASPICSSPRTSPTPSSETPRLYGRGDDV
jgi:hypothetical protein